MHQRSYQYVILHLTDKRIKDKMRLKRSAKTKKTGLHTSNRFKKVTSVFPNVDCKAATPRIVFFRSPSKRTVASDTATAVSRSNTFRILWTTTVFSSILFEFCASNEQRAGRVYAFFLCFCFAHIQLAICPSHHPCKLRGKKGRG